LGVWTDPAFRRLGLSSAVTAGTVEHCLSRGITDIGWQTLETNTGSIRVAEKVGFIHSCDYIAYSSELVAANQDDLTREEWKSWAKAYSYLPEQDGLTRYREAECWASSGEAERALSILEGLIDSGYLTRDLVSLLHSSPFLHIRSHKGWVGLVERLKRGPGNKVEGMT
jgi:hypothetical protein